jgi:hypothetical protein
MCITSKDRHPEEIWEAIWCIVCGETEFTYYPFEGAYCDECGTKVLLKLPTHKGGFPEKVTARFYTETTWNLDKPEKNRRPIPTGIASVTFYGDIGDFNVGSIGLLNKDDDKEYEWEAVEEHEFEDVEEPEEVQHLA